jgi:hypothetical protein
MTMLERRSLYISSGEGSRMIVDHCSSCPGEIVPVQGHGRRAYSLAKTCVALTFSCGGEGTGTRRSQ